MTATAKDAVKSANIELAAKAEAHYSAGEFSAALDVLQKIEKTIVDKDDPRLLHNLRLVESAKGGFRQVSALREGLTTVRDKILAKQLAKDPELNPEQYARGAPGFVGAPEKVIAETLKLLRSSETDASILLYNLSALHFERKEYTAARAILEHLFRDIEPIEETVAVYVCLLLLDVLVHCSRGALLTEKDRVAFSQQTEQVLSHMEKLAVLSNRKNDGAPNGSAASSSSSGEDGGKGRKGNGGGGNNGGGDGTGGNETSPFSPEQAADFEFRLHLYRAKVLLMQHQLKASKKEIKSALEYLPKSRELQDSSAKGANSSGGSGDSSSGGVGDSAESLRNMTALYLKANFEYLRQNYRKALKLLSSSHTMSGMMLQLEGPDAAAAAERNAGGRAPNAVMKGVQGATYYNNVACVHHKMKRFHVALHYFEKAIAECGEANAIAADQGGGGIFRDGRLRMGVDCEVRYNAGLQLLLTGRPVEALGRFEEAAQLLYNRPQLWLRMAECCIQRHLQTANSGGGGSGSVVQAVAGGLGGETGVGLIECKATGGSPGEVTVIGSGRQRRMLLNTSSLSQTKVEEAAPGLSGLERGQTSLHYASKCLQNVLYLCASLEEAASKKAAKEGKMGIFGKKLTDSKDGNSEGASSGDSKSKKGGAGGGGSGSGSVAAGALDAGDATGSAIEAAASAASAASAEAAASAGGGGGSSSGGSGGKNSGGGNNSGESSADGSHSQAASLEATALLDLAFVHLALSNPVLALSYTTKLLKLRGPAAPPQLQFIAHLYAAEALCYLNKPSEALEHIESDPNHPPSSISFEAVASKLGSHQLLNPSMALTQSDSSGSAAAARSNADARTIKAALQVNMASAFALQGQMKQAEKCTRLALASSPHSAEAARMLVYILLRTEQIEEALKCLKLYRGKSMFSSGK